MTDRRGKRRIQVDTPLVISLDGQQLNTHMVDISEDGTLLRIELDSREQVSTMDLGKEATFVVRIKGGSNRRYKGEIIRFFTKTGDKFIALRFWEGYQELPS
jgi:hypothetical protein